MTDPVVDCNGISYQRSSTEQLPYAHNNVYHPNNVLQALVKGWVERKNCVEPCDTTNGGEAMRSLRGIASTKNGDHTMIHDHGNACVRIYHRLTKKLVSILPNLRGKCDVGFSQTGVPMVHHQNKIYRANLSRGGEWSTHTLEIPRNPCSFEHGGFASDEYNNTLVAHPNEGRVGIYRMDPQTGSYNLRSNITLPTQSFRPKHVCVAPGGHVVILDSQNERVYIKHPDSDQITQFPTCCQHSVGITVANGMIFVAGGTHVRRFDMDGRQNWISRDGYFHKARGLCPNYADGVSSVMVTDGNSITSIDNP
jgi:hypothetical protein